MISEDPAYLRRIFRHANDVFLTTGMADGIVIKYDRFYLKVYNDDSELNETFHLHIYEQQNPLLTVKLNQTQMVYIGKLLHSYTTPSQAKTLLHGVDHARACEEYPMCEC